MAAPKQLNADQQAKLLSDVSTLRAEGYTQAEIARRLKLTQQMVSYYLRKARTQLLKQMRQSQKKIIAERLNELLHAQREYMKAWHRSYGKARETTTEREVTPKQADSGGEEISVIGKQRPETVKVKTVDLVGDVRFLDGFVKVNKEMRELFGVDAPKKVKHSGYVGSVDTSKLSTEQLQRIINGEDPSSVLADRQPE